MATWKLWIVLGLVLAILELLMVPAQFLLIALGVCAILVGVAALITDMGLQAQLAWYAGLAAVLVPVFVYTWRRRAPVRYPGPAGETPSAPQLARVVATDPLTVALRGDRFPAEGPEGTVFEMGEEVRVERFSGITATIRKLG